VLTIMRGHGIEYDHERAQAIHDALAPMRGLGLDAALLIHEDGATPEQAVQFVMKQGATTEPRAQQSVRFVTDPTWRAYVITYSAGGELAHAFHQDDPARFKRLLSENVRVSELLAAS
jgi:hypothetical protein